MPCSPQECSLQHAQHGAASCHDPVAHSSLCSNTIFAIAGVAMGAAGADVAIDSADVVLFTTDLRRLGSAMRIAKSARRKIGENIAIAVTAKVRALRSSQHVQREDALISLLRS
jgi:hypothetical protein